MRCSALRLTCLVVDSPLCLFGPLGNLIGRLGLTLATHKIMVMCGSVRRFYWIQKMREGEVSKWARKCMDKLQLSQLNLGRVFNNRYGRASTQISTCTLLKQPKLLLKTWPKQVLGYFPLAFALYWRWDLC